MAQIHLRCPCPNHGRSSNTAVAEVCKNLWHSAILVWGKSTGILFLEFQNLIQKNRHSSFLQSSYRVRDISRGVKCRDSMLSNNTRSSLCKNFGVIQVYKQAHKCEIKRFWCANTNARCLVIAPFRLLRADCPQQEWFFFTSLLVPALCHKLTRLP